MIKDVGRWRYKASIYYICIMYENPEKGGGHGHSLPPAADAHEHDADLWKQKKKIFLPQQILYETEKSWLI